MGRDDEAYTAFYKAVWNQAWQSAGYHALAEIDCCQQKWTTALEHLDRSLRFNTDHLRARDLRVVVLRKLGRDAEAQLHSTLELDPLDWWARYLAGEKIGCDTQTRLDMALDFVRAGLFASAIELLNEAKSVAPIEPVSGTAPMIAYTLGWIHEKNGDQQSALHEYRSAALIPPDYCFPARLEDITILEAAIRANPADPRAPYYELTDETWASLTHEPWAKTLDIVDREPKSSFYLPPTVAALQRATSTAASAFACSIESFATNSSSAA